MDSGFWSLADYEHFTSLPSLGGPLLRVDEEPRALSYAVGEDTRCKPERQPFMLGCHCDDKKKLNDPHYSFWRVNVS